jgi:SNF2-related domain
VFDSGGIHPVKTARRTLRLLSNLDLCAAAWALLVGILRPAGGGLMWRSSKADVAAELGLPPQHERCTPLQLSAVERHFYNRQHQVPLAGCIRLYTRTA